MNLAIDREASDSARVFSVTPWPCQLQPRLGSRPQFGNSGEPPLDARCYGVTGRLAAGLLQLVESKDMPAVGG